MNILVVDDDLEIAQLIASVLTAEGHKTRMADCASAALGAALMTEFDLLICDLMLPDLQGTEIVRAIKAQSPNLPVIVISALDKEEWAAPCEDAGATCFLQKPLSLDKLRSEVALVQRARLSLNIAIVDGDRFHQQRVMRALESFGCTVISHNNEDKFITRIKDNPKSINLLLVDAGNPAAEIYMTGAKQAGIAIFVFGEHISAAKEDELMRQGAAVVLDKPVDIAAFINQAAFMAG